MHKPTVTLKNIEAANELFQILEYGSGKIAAGTVLTSTVNAYVKQQVAQARSDSLLTQEELDARERNKAAKARKAAQDDVVAALMKGISSF